VAAPGESDQAHGVWLKLCLILGLDMLVVSAENAASH
jgi:hypothetical protein